LLIPAIGLLIGCGDGGGTGTGSSSSGTGSGMTSDGGPIAAATGLDVAATDFYGGTPYALGYPSYAIDGCRLVYLAPGAGGLKLRDLHTGDETTIADAAEEPRRPSIVGDVITWEATVSGAPGVRVKGKSGDVITLAGAFDHAGEPRAAGDAVVFTAWLGPNDTDDTDIYLYRPDTQALTAVGATPKQQRFPDISATHLAWTDFGDDASGYYKDIYNQADEADVVTFERATSKATTRHLPGKQAFPILGATGKVAYLDWVGVEPEPKLDGYALQIANLGAPVELDALVAHIETTQIHVRPLARGALLEWVASAGGSSSLLLRRPADLSASATVVPGLDGVSLVGPTASDTITLVGVQKSGAAVELRAFAR
jgi:hypothetical protein